MDGSVSSLHLIIGILLRTSLCEQFQSQFDMQIDTKTKYSSNWDILVYD